MDKETVRNSQVRIVTDIALWNLLLQGVKKQPKYSRLEAFRDLMQRQAVQNSDESKNHTSPFFVTVSELSVLWGWHRHTVSAFLEKLSALEYLTIEKVTNGFNLHLIALFVPDL